MKRHVNIPIFIPHLGCPHACVFCNQRRISGKTSFDIKTVPSELERAAATIDYSKCDVEIAYFGGSFTGIDSNDMIYLLALAKDYIDAGKAQSIRISTRPDYIDNDILDRLERYGVTDIELGLQSMNDRVLAASQRGHTAECARAACKMIKSRGFNLVGQMMIGLPESTAGDEIETAREIASMCDAARIYPTVVFRDTMLCDMMNGGSYTPLTMDDAVKRSEGALDVFISADIPVIRLGLCAADNLFEPGTMVGGAYHSAFGEFVYSEHYMRVMRNFIESRNMRGEIAGKNIIISVPVGETSKVSGQKRINKLRLQNEYNVKNIKIIEKPDLIWYNIKIESE